MIYNLDERLGSAWKAFKAEPATVRQDRYDAEQKQKLDEVTSNVESLPRSAQDRIDRFVMSPHSYNNKEVVALIEDISILPLPAQIDIVKMAVGVNPSLVGFAGMQKWTLKHAHAFAESCGR